MRLRFVWVAAILLMLAGCNKSPSGEQVVVEIPAGFNGNFVLNMGVKNAAPLARQGDRYVVTVPSGGNVETSSLLTHPKVTFKNASDGSVWGYSQFVFTTGDGIPVGGKIEFFVGTKSDYDAEQGRRKHSFEVKSSGELVAEM